MMFRPKPGDVVEYHGRTVEVIDVAMGVETPSGGKVDVVRVRDPRRGLRGMFVWQLEAGIGAKPEKALTPERDEAAFA